MSRRRHVLWATALCTLAVLCPLARFRLVQSWFIDGRAGPAPALPGREQAGTLPAAGRVRVLLVDGLARATASKLPHMNMACALGLDLTVDNGFPTESLPIQHVLWTGRTQQQSGVLYRVSGLAQPPAGSLPSQVTGSVAVAEAYVGIARSFGFATVRPTPVEESEGFRQRFADVAEAAVASDARLVFVHVLRVDEAGHAEGAASARYAAAAAWSDELLARLMRADARGREPSAFVVLSDHGHLPGGGHGDAEPGIRLVRACLIGTGFSPGPSNSAITLPDLSRTLFDLLRVAPAPDAAGRTLSVALRNPAIGATLPRISTRAWLTAVVLVALASWAAWRWRIGVRAWPLALALAWLGPILRYGWPSLSQLPFHTPFGMQLLEFASPGLLCVPVQLWWASARHGTARVLTAHVVGVCLTISIPLVLLIGSLPGPPWLLPRVSAYASLALAVAGPALLLGLPVLARREIPSDAALQPGPRAD